MHFRTHFCLRSSKIDLAASLETYMYWRALSTDAMTAWCCSRSCDRVLVTDDIGERGVANRCRDLGCNILEEEPS